MRYLGSFLGIGLLVLVGCPRSRPVVVTPKPRDAGVETPVPDVDLREARLRPRKHHAPLALEAAESTNQMTGNGEDSTVYCATLFGRGVGVTCHAWLDLAHQAHGECYYENGYVVDTHTGQSYWRAGTGDRRPYQGEVRPFGYCTENGCTEDTWLECPWKGRGATPQIQEFCLAMARSEYHEGYAFCGQAP